MSPKSRGQGLAVRRQSAGSPKTGSRVRVEQRAPVPDDRAPAAPAFCADTSNAGSPAGGASAEASTDSLTSPTRRSAAAPERAPRKLPDPQVEPVRAAAGGARSRAHAGAGGSQVPSNAPICTTARSIGAAGRVPDRRATSPRTTSKVGEAEAIDLRADAALRPRTGFLNPTASPVCRYGPNRALCEPG